MKHKIRYIKTKEELAKHRLRAEHVLQAQWMEIRYVDTKGKVRKFSKKLKLKVEVRFRLKFATGKTKLITSVSYGLPSRYRQKPVSEDTIYRQIKRKHIEKMKRGHLIYEEEMQNLYRWTYIYHQRTKAEKQKYYNEKRKRMRRLQRERRKTRKNKKR